jgi:predicted DNA-binding transcriptional regulator AlpA
LSVPSDEKPLFTLDVYCYHHTPNVYEAVVNRRLTNRAATQPRRGLDHDEAAVFIGVTVATFDQMVDEGRLPQPVDLNGEIVWDMVQLDRAADRLFGLRRSAF